VDDLFGIRINGAGQEQYIPARSGNEIQQAAYRSHREKADKQRQSVLASLRAHGRPMMAEELVDATGIMRTSMCGRLKELEHMELVEKHGTAKARTGKTVNQYRIKGTTDGNSA